MDKSLVVRFYGTRCMDLNGDPPQSYRASPAMLDPTVVSAT